MDGGFGFPRLKRPCFTFKEEEEADDEDHRYRYKNEARPHGVVVVAHETDTAQRVAINL